MRGEYARETMSGVYARGEYEIKNGKKTIKVDGYCKETNTIYEFHGCFYHGDLRKGCKLSRNWKADDYHAIRKDKTYGELYNETLERDKLLKELGYNLIVIWECEYKR